MSQAGEGFNDIVGGGRGGGMISRYIYDTIVSESPIYRVFHGFQSI